MSAELDALTGYVTGTMRSAAQSYAANDSAKVLWVGGGLANFQLLDGTVLKGVPTPGRQKLAVGAWRSVSQSGGIYQDAGPAASESE